MGKPVGKPWGPRVRVFLCINLPCDQQIHIHLPFFIFFFPFSKPSRIRSHRCFFIFFPTEPTKQPPKAALPAHHHQSRTSGSSHRSPTKIQHSATRFASKGGLRLISLPAKKNVTLWPPASSTVTQTFLMSNTSKAVYRSFKAQKAAWNAHRKSWCETSSPMSFKMWEILQSIFAPFQAGRNQLRYIYIYPAHVVANNIETLI